MSFSDWMYVLKAAPFWWVRFWMRPLAIVSESQENNRQVLSSIAAIVGGILWGGVISITYYYYTENIYLLWLVPFIFAVFSAFACAASITYSDDAEIIIGVFLHLPAFVIVFFIAVMISSIAFLIVALLVTYIIIVASGISFSEIFPSIAVSAIIIAFIFSLANIQEVIDFFNNKPISSTIMTVIVISSASLFLGYKESASFYYGYLAVIAINSFLIYCLVLFGSIKKKPSSLGHEFLIIFLCFFIRNIICFHAFCSTANYRFTFVI